MADRDITVSIGVCDVSVADSADEWFEQTEVAIEQHHSIYSIEKYLALLSTLSDYIALPADTREQLFKDLGEHLRQKQGEQPLPLVHWFAAHVAPLSSNV